MPWGEPTPIDWQARAEKAEAELRNLKTSIGTSTYKLTSTIDGGGVLGTIHLEDDRLCNQLNDGFGVMLAPVLHPLTNNLRWIHTFRPRQEMDEWVSYYPPKEEAEFAKWAECNPSIDKIDFAMAMALGHQLLMEETDNDG